jgi:hypothetical protein
MTPQELIKKAKILSKTKDEFELLTEALEFLRVYGGEKSSFYKLLYEKQKDVGVRNSEFNDLIYESYSISHYVYSSLNAFISYIENGLLNGMSIKRQAEIEIVNDIINQAKSLIDTKGIHPASACVLAGASLEEFLRLWIEEQNISIGRNKPSIDTYTKILRENNLIDKQDTKDITSWGGLRNHAAHGEWDFVSDKNKIDLMIDGINLFMRKYGEKNMIKEAEIKSTPKSINSTT